MAESSTLDAVGRATVMACPTCMTALYEVTDGRSSHFFCSNGHHYSLDEVCPGIEDSLRGLLGVAIEAVMKC